MTRAELDSIADSWERLARSSEARAAQYRELADRAREARAALATPRLRRETSYRVIGHLNRARAADRQAFKYRAYAEQIRNTKPTD